MASNLSPTRTRAFKLGRSSLTGQFVLKPVGRPSKRYARLVLSDSEFSNSEITILRLASRNLSNGKIASQLDIPESAVRKTIEKAKSRAGIKRRVDAAQRVLKAIQTSTSPESTSA